MTDSERRQYLVTLATGFKDRYVHLNDMEMHVAKFAQEVLKELEKLPEWNQGDDLKAARIAARRECLAICNREPVGSTVSSVSAVESIFAKISALNEAEK